MYQVVESRVNLSKKEEEILLFWEEYDIFLRSLKQRQDTPMFVQYDGPPFSTGLPHYGHLAQSILKDVFPRYRTMKGFYVPRRLGWDCHGLPVEYEVERTLGLKNKLDVEKYGIANFNEKCRETVLKYSQEWRRYFRRIGRWVDLDNDYKTMDPHYMESIWSLFKKLWELSLVKEGYCILPYCARCGTVLSNHELNLAGYKEVMDPSVSVRFSVKGKSNTYLLAWTTTPWTLPANLALAVNPKLTYITVRDKKEDSYTLLETRLSFYYDDEQSYTVIWKGLGEELSGLFYEPLFDYFKDLEDKGAFRIYCANYVTDNEGTGIVHTANGFGEDDYNLLKNTDLPIISPVDGECRFTQEISEYQGRFVKDCNEDILMRLQEDDRIITRENYLHNCPHCYRCGCTLIYRAIHSWFVLVSKFRTRLCQANEQVQWIPSHLKHGRFGKWLANARDWTISRNRYWGNPIPVWRCNSCNNLVVIGSRAELQEKSGVWLKDLHKHYVDHITIPCSQCHLDMTRISEIFDCWFESGGMPYAQEHYVFDQNQSMEHFLPADFVVEGVDQTRGWFYTLMVLAVALFDRPAFKMSIATGLVLANDGRKMSKSSRNYMDPLDIVNNYGADATRLYLLESSLTRGEDLRFDEQGVHNALKNTIIPLWNSYSFFVTYANIDGFQPQGKLGDLDHPLDLWVVSSVWRLVDDIDDAMEHGDVCRAVYEIGQFIDQLNNWYIRRSRRRFWKSENDADKSNAYETLYFTLLTLIKVCSPFLPFVTEMIYRNIKRESDPISVHLCDWPISPDKIRDIELENRMAMAIKTVAIGHRLRSMYNLKTRLPLRKLYVVSSDVSERATLNEMTTILAEELNVKQVDVLDKEDNLITYKAKANFRVLGPILGDDMSVASSTIVALDQDQIQGILNGTVIVIGFQGKIHQQLRLDSSNVIIIREEKENVKALNEGTLTVALDTHITEDLRDEGMMRDLIRSIQNQRKIHNFAVTDRISLWIYGDKNLKRIVENFEQIIRNETLTKDLVWEKKVDAISVDCGDIMFEMVLKQIHNSK